MWYFHKNLLLVFIFFVVTTINKKMEFVSKSILEKLQLRVLRLPSRLFQEE